MQNALRIDRIYTENWFFLTIKRLHVLFINQCAIQKENAFLWVPVIFALGIALYFSLHFEPPIALTIFSLCLGGVLYVLSHPQKVYASIALIILIFLSGFSAAKIRTEHIKTPMIEKKISSAHITGTIASIEKMEEGGGSRIILSHLTIEKIAPNKTPKKIRLRIRKDENIQIGQRVKILAGLNPPSGPLIPEGFDFRRYLFFQEIGAVGFVYNEPDILASPPPTIFDVESIRHSIATQIYRYLPPDSAAIAVALMVGQKNAISQDNKQAIRDAGLAHMLAISGLHVGLFAGTLFFILRLAMACIPNFALRYPIKKIAAICALGGAIFYMLLAGVTVPTQRAVFMISIVFLAIILDRSPISLRLVAASALIVLLFRPESLLSVSFQMSFAAVISLVYFYDVTRPIWMKLYTDRSIVKKGMMYFLGVCITTIIASLATAPFALYHFGQVSFIGSVANLMAVPLLTFLIMPFALLSIILMPLGLSFLPLTIMDIGIKGMLEISYWAASLPHAILRASLWPFSSFILIIVSCLFIILWKGKGKLLGIPLFFIAFWIAQASITPDILISSSHKLFLFKTDEDTLLTSSRRSDRFVLKNWEKLYGLPEKSAQILPNKGERKSKEDQNNNNNCGEQGCRFLIKGYKVSFSRIPYISEQECAWADILIAVDPVKDKSCHARYIIDKFDTWKFGTHAVWLKPEGIVIQSVAQTTANRPWSKYTTAPNKKYQ